VPDAFGRLATGIQYLLPQHALTALVHRLMRTRVRWIKNLQIRALASVFGIDWSEAATRDLSAYPHFNAFFTRALRDGARPADPDPSALLSPCDGRISEHGRIDGERVFQAKGHACSLAALLAGDPRAGQWENGWFCTIYLSPRDYHRVHMPLDGALVRMTYVPGQLFSVAPYTVRHVPGLFARNERVVSVFDTALGPVALVLVGAMLVAGMETVWAGEITPSRERDIRVTEYREGEVVLPRGAEMGRFNMGSTVILLLPRGAVSDDRVLQAGERVMLGRRIATLHFPRARESNLTGTGRTAENT